LGRVRTDGFLELGHDLVHCRIRTEDDTDHLYRQNHHWSNGKQGEEGQRPGIDHRLAAEPVLQRSTGDAVPVLPVLSHVSLLRHGQEPSLPVSADASDARQWQTWPA